MAHRTHIALLRGINVGGRNRLPMEDLRSLVEQAGGERPRTYIQSGNVVFEASAPVAKQFATDLESLLEERVGVKSPVVVRSAAEIEAVPDAVPFSGPQADPASLHVMFLAAQPTKARAAALDPSRSPGDRFGLVGREIYLHLPRGVARTKLTNAYFDSILGTLSTARNWRTVQTLIGMCAV
ncbi:MAG: DUF1697 domain-containing protein [Phycisphaerales bacterium JB041]